MIFYWELSFAAESEGNSVTTVWRTEDQVVNRWSIGCRQLQYLYKLWHIHPFSTLDKCHWNCCVTYIYYISIYIHLSNFSPTHCLTGQAVITENVMETARKTLVWFLELFCEYLFTFLGNYVITTIYVHSL